MKGLEDMLLYLNAPVTGLDKGQHCKGENRKRVLKQSMQVSKDYWSHHRGDFSIHSPKQVPNNYKGYICPAGFTINHPDAEKLLQFSTKGCPTMTR